MDATDPIEAAIACTICRNAHVPALLSTQLANEDAESVRRLAPRTRTEWVDSDGAGAPTEDDGN